jgi:hypothetical protein
MCRLVFSWRFAYESIVNEDVRARFDCYKWTNIKEHLNRCREYRRLHVQELTGKLTDEQKKRVEVMSHRRASHADDLDCCCSI